MDSGSALLDFAEGISAVVQTTTSSVVAESNCYLVAGSGRDVHLIDPGEAKEGNWRRLIDGLATRGRELADVASIIVTHLHEDHLGIADRVRRASGATLVMLSAEQRALDERGATDDSAARLERWGVPVERRPELLAVARARAERHPVQADLLMEPGESVALGPRCAVAVWTPGHTRGHLCVDLPDDGLVFTGDHLLPSLYPGIGLGGRGATNPLVDYYASLAAVADLGSRRGLPGHGGVIADVATRVAQTRRHHERRGEEITAAVDERGRLTTWELAARLRWSAGWQNLRNYSLDSALRQVDMHLERKAQTSMTT